MSHPKRIEPVENLSEQAGNQSTQRKILRLKSFDARIEKRDPLPVQLYLASLPGLANGRSRKTSVPTALECSPSDAGNPAKPRCLPP
jgi:hypothetical protein